VHLLQKLLVALFDQDSHENCRSTSDLPVHFRGSARPIPERPHCSLGRRFLTTLPVKNFFSHCPLCFDETLVTKPPGMEDMDSILTAACSTRGLLHSNFARRSSVLSFRLSAAKHLMANLW
jgi:hypothetical protein